MRGALVRRVREKMSLCLLLRFDVARGDRIGELQSIGGRVNRRICANSPLNVETSLFHSPSPE